MPTVVSSENRTLNSRALLDVKPENVKLKVYEHFTYDDPNQRFFRINPKKKEYVRESNLLCGNETSGFCSMWYTFQGTEQPSKEEYGNYKIIYYDPFWMVVYQCS